MEQEATYVGIDVVKSRVEVATHPGGDVWRVDYDESGIASLIARLQSLNPATVLLVSALAAASLPVVVVNPRQVRDFAKVTGKLAKTDALDARVLAQFASAVRPALRPLRDADTQNLNELTTRRNQLITMLVAEKNRLGRGTG
jgi:transposase